MVPGGARAGPFGGFPPHPFYSLHTLYECPLAQTTEEQIHVDDSWPHWQNEDPGGKRYIIYFIQLIAFSAHIYFSKQLKSPQGL